MSFTQINWHPDKKFIRNFGIIVLIMLPLISYLLQRQGHISMEWFWGICGGGVGIFLCCLVSYSIGRSIYLAFAILTYPIGLVVSFLLIGLLYYAVITPIGLIFMLLKKDPLSRRFDRSADSYWLERGKPKNINSYYRLS